MEWTGEAIAELKRLWGEGKSYQQIATVLGTSRGSISSKCRKLGLRRKPLPARPAIEMEPKLLPDNVVTMPVRQEDLLSYHCRYPMNGGPDWVFCGLHTTFDSSYCEKHRKICMTKARAG